MTTEQTTDRAALARAMVDEWFAATPQPPITDLLLRFAAKLDGAEPKVVRFSPMAAVPCSVPVRGRWIEFIAIDNHTGGGVEARMAEALVTLFADATPDGVGHLLAAKVLAEMRNVLGLPAKVAATEQSEVRF